MRSVAVPFSPYRLSCLGDIINSCCYQSSPLFSGYEHTEVYRHAQARTYNNTHDRMVGSRHTQVRCEERSKSKSLYLIAQQSGVECSAYFEHVQIRCFFRAVRLFSGSLQFFAPLFLFLRLGVSPGNTKKRKKERKKIKSIEKRGGVKKKKKNPL